jgi:hypothetical protein
LIKEAGLGGGARKAVQDAAMAAIGLGKAGGYHLLNEFVADEMAGVEEALNLQAENGAGAAFQAEHFAGRDGWNGERAGQTLRLGAFARAGRPEENDYVGRCVVQRGYLLE